MSQGLSFRSKILLQLAAALVGIVLISALAVWQVR